MGQISDFFFQNDAMDEDDKTFKSISAFTLKRGVNQWRSRGTMTQVASFFLFDGLELLMDGTDSVAHSLLTQMMMMTHSNAASD